MFHWDSFSFRIPKEVMLFAGASIFPNARYVMSQTAWDFWA
jgi:hypothetical protein